MLNSASLQQLSRAIARYREIVARRGWTPLPGTARFTPGQTHDMIPALRARLVAERYLPADQAAGGAYDGTLADALRRFQRNHGAGEREIGKVGDGRPQPCANHGRRRLHQNRNHAARAPAARSA